MRFIFIIILFTFSSAAQARKIDMSLTGASAFFRFGAGMQNTGASFYDQSSGAQTRFSEDVPYNYSGELGFQYTFTPMMGVRLGAEFVQSQDTKTTGKGTGGTEYMIVNSSAFAFNPNMVLEATLKITKLTKTFFFLGAGFANMKVTNSYKFSAGNPYGKTSADNYKEAVEGVGTFYNAGLGFQVITVDNISTLFELGYRELHVKDLEYSQNVTNIQGSQVEGGTALAYDGTDRQAKIGGPYISVAFRFHFPQFN